MTAEQGSQSMGLDPPPPQAIVVFGASGDLTHRKLLPALYNLSLGGLLPERVAIVGFSRTSWSDDEFRDSARSAIRQFSRANVDDEHWRSFADSLFYVSGTLDNAGDFAPLHDRLSSLDKERGLDGRRLFYCATPPAAFTPIIDRLAECDMNGLDSRVVIEKPFGRDLASARQLTQTVHQVFDESRVFRIDHYLGKETVQNLLVFRFANSLFERIWNRDAIDQVQITVAEEVGAGNRLGYYNGAGAIRDMLQNHLLQVLSFLTMEPPRSLEPEAVRDEKIKLLRAVRTLDPARVVRGQYGPGTLNGESVKGFAEELGSPTDTETFVAAHVEIGNWRWSGVPFFLRTGKRLPRRETQIVVVLKDVPAYLYDTMDVPPPAPNHLVIRVQPSEGIAFTFQAKAPGPGFLPRTVHMDFDYDEAFGADPADAYERLLLDAMNGDHTLFTRADEVERAWELVGRLLESREQVCSYEAGSWGPREADELIAPRHWHLH